MIGRERSRVLLVCSPGGHFLQLLALEPAYSDSAHTWVTLPGADTESVLADERVVFAYGPTNRSLKNLARNSLLAWRVVRKLDPDVIVSTGAALAVPFFVVGKLRRKRLIYIESVSRVDGLSMSGKAVYFLADSFYVQWPALARLRRARFVGNVL
jgi:beta-1,4-N-acetylglucosaminyltransferase